jgi:hypothetical protein
MAAPIWKPCHRPAGELLETTHNGAGYDLWQWDYTRGEWAKLLVPPDLAGEQSGELLRPIDEPVLAESKR